MTNRGLPLTNVCLQWRVETLEDGKAAIQIPANIFPSRSLSYEGEAGEGKTIVPGRLSDFPTREWRIERAPPLPLPVPYLSVRHSDASLIVNLFVHKLAVFESLTKISSLLFLLPIFSRRRYAVPIQASLLGLIFLQLILGALNLSLQNAWAFQLIRRE